MGDLLVQAEADLHVVIAHWADRLHIASEDDKGMSAG
jgi:hypothetical protein